MEVKERSRKREIIKNIAIVFLTILLVLTFFSNTIMNRSLPEVATKSITSGTINAKIRGSGTVEANESYEVLIKQTRLVQSICVRVGDYVSQGDVLFILGDAESAELAAAQEQLDSLNLQYQQRLLNLSREYAAEDRTLQLLREELEDATRQRDENRVSDADISTLKGELTAAKEALAQTQRILEELNALMGDSDAYVAAQEAVNKWTAEVESAQALIEEYERQLDELESTGSIDTNRQLEDAREVLTSAENVLTSDWNAYKDWYEELLNAAGISWSGTLNKNILRNTNVQIKLSTYLTQQSLLSADERNGNYDLFVKAQSVLTADQEAVDNAQRAYDRLLDDLEDAEDDANSQYTAIRNKLMSAESAYTYANGQLQEANRALAAAESNSASVKNQIKTFEEQQRLQSAEIEGLTENIAELEEKQLLYKQALELVKEKERAIEDALAGKDIDKKLDDLELQSLRDQIEKAQAQVDRYTQESVGTEVTAGVSGMISSISVTAGHDATAGVAMATIELVDRGYMLKIPVTNEQSRQVRVGDTASVSNYYWGGEIEAVLESITSDPNNPGSGKLLIFRVTGDVNAGTNLTLSIGQRSANYDAIIPKSALRQDTNGYFVLVITVKSSPLSNRYIATRVDVQVLAEDDTSAAVSGLSSGDFVITTSSDPVEAGMQVRMVENP